jgi:arylsulfatase
MEVYAAQIDRLDQGVGRMLQALRAKNAEEDTLFIFLSDNGASDEDLPKVNPERFRTRTDIVRLTTRDGRPVSIGNNPSIWPGTEDTYASYGRAWANLSNTPFRYYKQWVHEGGIATPFIVHWPNGQLRNGSVVRTPFQLVDVLPTVLEAVGATVPASEGRSMLPALGGQSVPESTLYWEHTGNAAIRRANWKLVREFDRPWELYDVGADRSETVNLSEEHPEVVRQLKGDSQAWADRVGVIPFEVTLNLYRERGLTDEEAAG